MKTQFDTEKEAQEALDTVNLESFGWCPVIQANCRKDCICYYRGDIDHQEPNQFCKFPAEKEFWFVHYPCCTSPLINGEIRANVSY